MPIRQVVYVSSGTRDFAHSELKAIADVGRHNNNGNGVTGVLIHYNGNFLQLLEGAPEDVESTFLRIVADERHVGLIKLQDSIIAERMFPDYGMAFHGVSNSEATSYPDLFEKKNNVWKLKNGADFDNKIAILMKTFLSINSGER